MILNLSNHMEKIRDKAHTTCDKFQQGLYATQTGRMNAVSADIPVQSQGRAEPCEPLCSSQSASLTHLHNNLYNIPFPLFALSHLAEEKHQCDFSRGNVQQLHCHTHNIKQNMFSPASSTEASVGTVTQPVLSSGDGCPLRTASEMPISITRSALKSLLPHIHAERGSNSQIYNAEQSG